MIETPPRGGLHSLAATESMVQLFISFMIRLMV
jgi:hypothetical protein